MTRARAVAVPDGGFRHLAVLRLSSLGDIVLTLPVVHALRRAFPAAHIDYWVKEEFADLVRFDHAITHVRVLERDARRLEDLVSMSAELEDCDLIVDLHGNSRTRLLTCSSHGSRSRRDEAGSMSAAAPGRCHNAFCSAWRPRASLAWIPPKASSRMSPLSSPTAARSSRSATRAPCQSRITPSMLLCPALC